MKATLNILNYPVYSPSQRRTINPCFFQDQRIIAIAAVVFLAFLGFCYLAGCFKKTPALNGQGFKRYPDGTEEHGEFKENKLNGQGSRKTIDQTVWEGEFREGVFCNGIVRYPNGAILIVDSIIRQLAQGNKEFCGEVYQGTFELSKGRLVQGKYTNSFGEIYEGSFDQDEKLNGLGTKTDREGRKITGKFFQGFLYSTDEITIRITGKTFKGSDNSIYRDLNYKYKGELTFDAGIVHNGTFDSNLTLCKGEIIFPCGHKMRILNLGSRVAESMYWTVNPDGIIVCHEDSIIWTIHTDGTVIKQIGTEPPEIIPVEQIPQRTHLV